MEVSENVIPNVLIDVDNAPVTGGAVVIATFPEGQNKPYHDNKGVIWVKNGADKRKVFDNSELAEMMSECGNFDPDEAGVPNAVNALVHRSLNIKAPIRIFIFDDRVEIHSPGSLPNGLTIEDIKNGTSMPRNMFLFTNSNYLLPYTGAGSGVRRALEYDPNVMFTNGINDKEITHSANEFVITIPRKTDQVNDQPHSKTDPAQSKTDPVQQKTDPVNDQPLSKTDPANDQPQSKTDPANDQPQSKTDPVQQKNDPVNDQPLSKTDPVCDQPHYNKPKLKLSKKQQDIRNFCSIPRNRQEILKRAGVTDHFDNRKKYIYDLVEAGILERTIPDKPNDPNQKYRRKQ